ncbi:glycosyltransferase [bacterium]|nr:glycosyltransferase [bacterium]
MKVYFWGNTNHNNLHYLRVLYFFSSIETKLFTHGDVGMNSADQGSKNKYAEIPASYHVWKEPYTLSFLFPFKLVWKMKEADVNQVSNRYIVPAYLAYKLFGIPYLFIPYGDDFCNLPFGNGGYYSYKGAWAFLGRYFAMCMRKAIKACPLFIIRYLDRSYLDALSILEISPCDSRIKKIPTPLDFKDYSDSIETHEDVFSVFMPTRILWELDSSDDKGSGIMIHGFAMFRKSNPDKKIILKLIRRGPHLKKADALICKLCIADDVIWLPEMGRDELISHYRSSDAVFDQIGLGRGSSGMVTVEGMIYGKPVFVYQCPCVDRDLGKPPIVNVRNENDIKINLQKVMDGDWKSSGAAKKWAKQYDYEHVAKIYIPLLEELARGQKGTIGKVKY